MGYSGALVATREAGYMRATPSIEFDHQALVSRDLIRRDPVRATFRGVSMSRPWPDREPREGS